MLQLPGNSENAFANLNSISSAPVAYIEWNYNAIARPYIITSSSGGPISASSFNNTSSWTSTNGTIFKDTMNSYPCDIDSGSVIAITASGLGNTSSKPSHFNSAILNSPKISITSSSGFYKLVFYIKTDDASVYTSLGQIPSTKITASGYTNTGTSASGTGLDTYYRILPISNSGRSFGLDANLNDLLKLTTANTASSGSVVLRFDTNSYSAKNYALYRGSSSTVALNYIKTFNTRDKIITNFITGTANTCSVTVNNTSNVYLNDQFFILTDNGTPGLKGSEWKVTGFPSSSVIAASAVSFISSNLYNIPPSISFNSNTSSKIKFSTVIDNLSQQPLVKDAPPTFLTNVRVTPVLTLSSGGTVIENPYMMVKVYENDYSEADYNKTTLEIDSLYYRRVEILFGSTSNFDNISFQFYVESDIYNSTVLLYRPELYKIDQWEYDSSKYYPIDTLFYSFRPGEALLHPYVPDVDKKVNKTNISASGYKPSSFAVLNPHTLRQDLSPYKQMYNQISTNNLKYYISPDMGSSGSTPISIRAQYNNYISVNKVIVKGINLYSDLTQSSGSIVLFTGAGATSSSVTIPFSAGAFTQNGILSLFYNDATWSTSRPTDGTFPPKLSDSGVLQNVISNVSGISLLLNNAPPVIINNDTVDQTNKVSAHLLEISPRLEIDISNFTKSVSVTKSLDTGDTAAGFPMGFINANYATVVLSNVPVYKNSFPHTIFETFSEYATFSNMLRQNCKFTIGLKSPLNDFTDYVPLLTMYSDEWTVDAHVDVSVSLYDGAKTQLMATPGLDYFGEDESFFDTITNILDASGFSDYDYDQLRSIAKNRSIRTTHFWSDRTKETLMDVLKKYFVAHQIGSWFDEYGIMRFIDLDKIIYSYNDNSLTPDFAITDKEIKLVNKSGNIIPYIPNIISESYSTITSKKIGKVTLNYQIPIKSTSDGIDINKKHTERGYGITEQTFNQVWAQNEEEGLIKALIDKPVSISEKLLYSSPARQWSGTDRPRNAMTSFSGEGFLQGELISWTGLEFNFQAYTGFQSEGIQADLLNVANRQIIYDSKGILETVNDLLVNNPNATGVEYKFTGNIHGVLRGQKFTTPRAHYMLDDTRTSTQINQGWWPSASVFSKGIINSSTGSFGALTVTNNAQSNITFDKNVAVMSVSKHSSKNYPVVFYPSVKVDPHVPIAASSFNYFSTVFVGPNFKKMDWKKTHADAEQVEFGIVIDTANGKFMFNLRNNKNTTKLITDNTYSNYNIMEYVTSGKTTVLSPVSSIQVADIYDGKPHRFSILFHNTERWSVPQKGPYKFCTFFIDNNAYGPYLITGKTNKSYPVSPKTQWGVYANHVGKAVATKNTRVINVKELYACRWFPEAGEEIDGKYIKHHWETKKFLDLLLTNDSSAEPSYFMWGPVHISGVKFYEPATHDEKYSPSYPTTLGADFTAYPTGAREGEMEYLGDTKPGSVTISTLFSTPFRTRFAVVNADDQLVFLNTRDGSVPPSGAITPLTISGYYCKLTDTLPLEKIIDPTSLTNTISMTIPWIQSKQDAETLMTKIAAFASSFNSDVNVAIFGNPLIQVGDFCKMVYSLKKIGYNPEEQIKNTYNDKIFFVRSVTQTYAAGLKTELGLKPMFQLPQ